MWSRGVEEVVMIPSQSRETKSGDLPCAEKKGRMSVSSTSGCMFFVDCPWIWNAACDSSQAAFLADVTKQKQTKPKTREIDQEMLKLVRVGDCWVGDQSPPQLSVLRLSVKCTTQFCDCLFTAVNCFEMTPSRSEGVVKWSIEDPLTIS